MADEALALDNVPKSGLADADAATVSSVFSAQAVAVIVNAFAKSKRRDEQLFRSMSRVVLALPPDSFDAQAIAGIANGFASADVRPHDEALFARLNEIATQLEPGSWTPYVRCKSTILPMLCFFYLHDVFMQRLSFAFSLPLSSLPCLLPTELSPSAPCFLAMGIPLPCALLLGCRLLPHPQMTFPLPFSNNDHNTNNGRLWASPCLLSTRLGPSRATC